MKYKLFSLLVLLLCCYSCKNEQVSDDVAKAYKVNEFIKSTMEDVYLWYKEMPDISPESETNPKNFYKKLLYTEDKWSYITDNANALTNSLSGIETTFGYQLAFYRTTSNADEYFAVVEYVNANTPASAAGISRGDYFVRINGEKINASNYMELINGSSITLTKADLVDRNIVETSETITLTSKKLTINPVLYKSVIEKNGIKIGYMVYTSYVGDLNNLLEEAFAYFKAENVSEFVLDLRFNSGGDETASTYLCSSLAPKDVVDNQSILIYNKWNDKYDEYWREHNYTNRIERRFEEVPYNLNLNRLYVLTSSSTASASELTIIGLMPYMNVVKIGETTYGKYTSMILIQPKDKSIANWALLPIIAKYTNADGYTDFKDGLTPDYEVTDNLFPAVALGNEKEPLLSKALELITGVSTQAEAAKSKRVPVDFEFVTTLQSRFDEFRSNFYLKYE